MLTETVKNGAAVANFYDDYCRDTTKEEIYAILKYMAQITYPEMLRCYMGEKID